MAASAGKTGFGSLLKIGNGASTETFSSILEVRSIDGPNLDLEFVDATHMESPSGYREQKPTFKSGGDVTIEVNFLPDDTSTQASLLTDFDNKTLRNFKLTFATFNKVWSFAAYVKSVSPKANIDDMLTASIVLQISGAVTRGAS